MLLKKRYLLNGILKEFDPQSYSLGEDDESATTEQLWTKVSKVAKIKNRYNQVPHLTQDTKGKVKYLKSTTTRLWVKVSKNLITMYFV